MNDKAVARISSGPGSKQDYGTPPSLIEQIEKRFGSIRFDLAANAKNTKAPAYFSTRNNALTKEWCLECPTRGSVIWLNPPFRDMEPWLRRCIESSKAGLNIVVIAPLSLTAWFRELIIGQADVYFLEGRIRFVGAQNGATRDHVIAHYWPGTYAIPSTQDMSNIREIGHSSVNPRRSTKHYIWRWKEESYDTGTEGESPTEDSIG